MGVHQHTAVNGYKKIRPVPLSKFKKTISGIFAANGLPWFGHLSCLLVFSRPAQASGQGKVLFPATLQEDKMFSIFMQRSFAVPESNG